MILPNNNKWIQINGSDIESSIDSSRNIDLKYDGYIGLSKRYVAIKSENGDANFDMCVAYGYSSSSSFYVASVDQPYTLTYDGTLTVSEDVVAGNPNLSIYSDGITWQDRWYVTGSSSLTYKAYSGGAWTSVTLSPTLTGSVPHSMARFENRQTLVITNGTQVKQINTSHADTTNLTLPATFNANRVVYNNNRVGITADSISTDKKTSVYFFIWDGSSTEASQGIPLGCRQELGLEAYKSTFVILTDTGRLLSYNGSGFDELAVLPIYAIKGILSNNKVTRGKTIEVRGDDIYINVPSQISIKGERGEQYNEKFPAGQYCYSPKRGLYHTSSNSNSLAFTRTVATTDVNTTTDVITVATTVPPTGTPCKYYQGGGAVITGLRPRKTYYVIKVSATTLKLATSKSNANAGTAIDLTGTGNSFQVLTFYPEYDFGQSYCTRSGGIASLLDLPLTTADTGSGFITSSNVPSTSVTTEYGTMCIGIDGIENRGNIVTGKIYTNSISDMFQSVYVYYKKLKYDVDKIIIKYRNSDFDTLNQPSYLNGSTIYSTWSSTTVFTTTDDLSLVVAGYEVDIHSGSGAGQLAHISSISESGGTYTVTLDEVIIGVTAGDTCYVSISNFKKIGTITYTDPDDQKFFRFDKPSSWVQLKIEFRGIDVKIKQLNLVRTEYQSKN